MSSSVIATASPAPQGHCSRCGKVWTLKERQGVCQWCLKPASCQYSTSKPRHIKSSRRRKQRQAPVHSNGYDQLEGEWLAYYRVASRFTDRVKPQDKEDILHTIMATLADVERNNGHKPFTEAVMYRIASRTIADYWRTYYKASKGLDCGSCSQKQRRKCRLDDLYTECPKAIKLESLNQPIIDSEGHTTELGELIADDKALDLDAWVDARTFLLGFPQRLLLIADKLNSGQALTNKEHQYLWRFRQREQKRLIAA
jgi:DNA-directed RNA polymerase specialized sigma24 family protein